MWIVAAFAFGQPVISRVVNDRFKGEWKNLHRSLFDFAEVRADRALLEMATQMRVLDDMQELSAYFRQTNRPPFGRVVQGDGNSTDLYYRDLTNKIMHAAGFRWDTSDPDNPVVICLPHATERWERADINIVALMGLVGSLSN